MPPSPSPAVRALLVAEVLLYVAAFAAYAWFVLPIRPAEAAAWRVALAAMLIVVPIALNLLHGDRPADSGIRLDNLRASARRVVPATLVMAVFVAAGGLAMWSFGGNGWVRLAELSGGYLVWGFAQQYLLQAFALRRLRQAGIPAWPAAVMAAVLFAAAHAPNWPLVAATAAGGVVWCGLFLRVPNLLTLGLAHAALAVLVYHCWFGFIQGMTIGRMFLAR